jgi:hypothetical protein
MACAREERRFRLVVPARGEGRLGLAGCSRRWPGLQCAAKALLVALSTKQPRAPLQHTAASRASFFRPPLAPRARGARTHDAALAAQQEEVQRARRAQRVDADRLLRSKRGGREPRRCCHCEQRHDLASERLGVSGMEQAQAWLCPHFQHPPQLPPHLNPASPSHTRLGHPPSPPHPHLQDALHGDGAVGALVDADEAVVKGRVEQVTHLLIVDLARGGGGGGGPGD